MFKSQENISSVVFDTGSRLPFLATIFFLRDYRKKKKQLSFSCAVEHNVVLPAPVVWLFDKLKEYQSPSLLPMTIHKCIMYEPTCNILLVQDIISMRYNL